ncbi:hypothetical protein R6Z07F_002944 [Ovis aries]
MGFCVCSCCRRWGPGEGGGQPLPDPPFLSPATPRKGALAGRGRPLCASRGAGPAQGAPSGGRGDRGAGSAGQEANLGVWREKRKRNFCVTS